MEWASGQKKDWVGLELEEQMGTCLLPPLDCSVDHVIAQEGNWNWNRELELDLN